MTGPRQPYMTATLVLQAICLVLASTALVPALRSVQLPPMAGIVLSAAGLAVMASMPSGFRLLNILNAIAAAFYLAGWGSQLYYEAFPPDVAGALINPLPILLPPIGMAAGIMAILAVLFRRAAPRELGEPQQPDATGPDAP